MAGFDDLFARKPVNPSEVFELRDKLGTWLILKLTEDWRTNSGSGMGDDFERGVFDIVEQMITEGWVGRKDE